jgi:D-amino-acid dehydrogenase
MTGATAVGNQGDTTIVIGAGLVGVCTALYLQRAGHNVIIVERTGPGDGASGHNGGIFSVGNCVPTATGPIIRSVPRMLYDPLSALSLRWSYLPRMVPWLMRFAWSGRAANVERASVSLASLLSESVSAYKPLLAGRSAELVLQSGLLYAYATDRAFDADRVSRDLRARRGIRSETLDRHGLCDIDAELGHRFARGILLREAPYTPDPLALVTQLAQQFLSFGGQLVIANVQGFVPGAAYIRQIQTTRGRLNCANVVIAAGAWSARLARMLGDRVPLETERGYGVTIARPNVKVPLPLIAVDHHVGFVPMWDGLKISGISELGGIDAPPQVAIFDRLIAAAKRVYPELSLTGIDNWMSYRPSTPDSLPVIGRATSAKNVYYAFGHGHIGLTLAAVTGKLVSELISDGRSAHDIDPFSVRRFQHLFMHSQPRRTVG